MLIKMLHLSLVSFINFIYILLYWQSYQREQRYTNILSSGVPSRKQMSIVLKCNQTLPMIPCFFNAKDQKLPTCLKSAKVAYTFSQLITRFKLFFILSITSMIINI